MFANALANAQLALTSADKFAADTASMLEQQRLTTEAWILLVLGHRAGDRALLAANLQ
ncbi:MAG: hypothetical protein KAI24_03000 [Planctomycetes bacterium]|nr:hypothetical protein [Planctomycetota bacterium]